MRELYERIASGYYIVATWLLVALAYLLLFGSFWEIASSLIHGEVLGILDAAGLAIIGFAIIETAKFIAEEELLRDKELRSAVESRRSLTKFITIIVIAASLEALVMTFETSRTDVTKAIYPATLFASTMFALVALGAYQWLSSRIAPPPDETSSSVDHSAPKEPVAAEPADAPIEPEAAESPKAAKQPEA